MGIEFLKYLLAASRVAIDCYTAENLHPNKSFNLCIEHEKQIFLNSSGKNSRRGHQSSRCADIFNTYVVVCAALMWSACRRTASADCFCLSILLLLCFLSSFTFSMLFYP